MNDLVARMNAKQNPYHGGMEAECQTIASNDARELVLLLHPTGHIQFSIHKLSPIVGGSQTVIAYQNLTPEFLPPKLCTVYPYVDK